MRDYAKGVAVLFALWAMLAFSTFATARSDRVYDLARASAQTICSYGMTSACRTLARIRAGKTGQTLRRT